MEADCAKFQADNAEILAGVDIPAARDLENRAGHDFWLTRNHHGAGFWDGDYQEPEATILTNASHAFGEFNLYIGDDGKVHGQ